MNNKKDNYKNYKYVYTGYKDYCNEHNIKAPEMKKEHIDHDHRFAFDFNNPTEHHHDYGFDLPVERTRQQHLNRQAAQSTVTYHTPEPIPPYQNKTTSYQNRSRTTSYQTKTTSTATTTKNNKNKKNNNGCAGCFVVLVFLFLFFSPLIGLIAEVIDELSNDYESSYNESNYSDTYYDSYQDAIEDYSLAIKEQDYNYIKDRVLYENTNNIWYREIENIKYMHPTVNFTNSYIHYERQLNTNELFTLEDNVNTEYYNPSVYYNISDAYMITICFTINNETLYKSITIGNINDYWYILT